MGNLDKQIKQARKMLNLGAKVSDTEEIDIINLKDMFAGRFLETMKPNGLDSVVKLRIKKKLLKLGYTEKQIDEYEDHKAKRKHGIPVEITKENEKWIA